MVPFAVLPDLFLKKKDFFSWEKLVEMGRIYKSLKNFWEEYSTLNSDSSFFLLNFFSQKIKRASSL